MAFDTVESRNRENVAWDLCAYIVMAVTGVTLNTASDCRLLSDCRFWPIATKSDSRR